MHAAEKEELVEAAREQAAREAQEAREAAVREAVTSCKASMQAKHEEAMERLRAESEKREKNAAEAAAAEKARFKAATEGRAQELLREGLTKLESVTDDAQRQARAVESTACALRVRRGEREGGREREGERGRGRERRRGREREREKGMRECCEKRELTVGIWGQPGGGCRRAVVCMSRRVWDIGQGSVAHGGKILISVRSTSPEVR